LKIETKEAAFYTPRRQKPLDSSLKKKKSDAQPEKAFEPWKKVGQKS